MQSRRTDRTSQSEHCLFHKTKMDFQDHFKEESQTKLNKKVEFKKSMSLPDFSMNVTYILKWLSRLRRQETYEGELGLRKINKNYYSEYSLNEISKNRQENVKATAPKHINGLSSNIHGKI